MNLALETHQNEGKHLAVPTNLLKNENFFRKHTVSDDLYVTEQAYKLFCVLLLNIMYGVHVYIAVHACKLYKFKFKEQLQVF